jgi:rhodanese-related sulfurtransferase
VHALLQFLGPGYAFEAILLHKAVITGNNVSNRIHFGCFEISVYTLKKMPLEITPAAAREKLATESNVILLDVREPEEYALAHVDGSLLMPMQSVPAELQKLEAMADEGDLLVLCHHGVRSLQVAAWLQARGVENAVSVAGGIDRWSVEIDASVPRY